VIPYLGLCKNYSRSHVRLLKKHLQFPSKPFHTSPPEQYVGKLSLLPQDISGMFCVQASNTASGVKTPLVPFSVGCPRHSSQK
jgi:hypothetical protein